MKYILIVFLLAGCSAYSEKTLTNAEIISAKTECEKAGMSYAIISIDGNLNYPHKVVCVNKK
jgi:hypothetical protein